jgi:AcrR family transcriptional regulator
VRRGSRHLSTGPPSMATSKRKTRAPGDRTRQALLDAAVAIWSQSGIDAVTMHEVALRAGKTRRTVYHHFSDRQELLSAARQNIDAALNTAFSDIHPERLGDPFDLVAGLVVEAPEIVRSHLRDMLDQNGGDLALRRRAIRYFKKMHREGRLHEHVDPTQAALVIFGMWFAAMLSTSMAADAASRRMQAKQFTNTFRQVVFRALVK